MSSPFFAWISRLRWIKRWSLMRNSYDENVMEHSWEVATITHALAVIRNTHFNGNLDVNACTVAALYHDVAEVITADMPSPVKYYSDTIRDAYKTIEQQAGKELLNTLPESLRSTYSPLLDAEGQDDEIHKLIKAADSLSAYIKCRLERVSGNHEFETAEKKLERALIKMAMPEVEYFMDNFVGSYGRNLDQILRGHEL